jgi:hypothetical protein
MSTQNSDSFSTALQTFKATLGKLKRLFNLPFVAKLFPRT